MNTQQFLYSTQYQLNSKYNLENIDYNKIQSASYQVTKNNHIPNEIYETNYIGNNQINAYNTQNQINEQYNDNNNIYNIYPEDTSNQINTVEPKNNFEQFNLENEYIPSYEQNTNYQINNIEYNINTNTNTNMNINKSDEQINTYKSNENNQNNYIENNNIISNNINKEEFIQLEENTKQINSSMPNIGENQRAELENNNQNINPSNIQNEINPEENNINNKDNLAISNPKSEISNTNKSNQEQVALPMNQLNPPDLNQSPPKQEERGINIPILANPLESNLTPSSNIEEIKSKNEESEIERQFNIIQYNQEEKELNYNNLLQAEEIVLRNNEEYKKTLFDFKSHFDLALTKEKNNFFYKKVHKVITPLLAHYEMPQDLKYISPLLSKNEKYLACIGKGDTDWVFVWEMSNLYWYKYKFSFSVVDCITFTPDSKNIIIIYKDVNPIMYDLSTGKMKLKFEKNGEENNRQGYQCSFTTTGTHFALTTTQSYTLWSLRNGKIRQRIVDNSPVKIITSECLINVDSELNCVIKKIFDQSIIEKFQIKGISSPEEILDGRCTDDMENFIYVIKHGIVIYNFRKREFKGIQRFEFGVERASLSIDGRYVMKTNMKNLCINDLKKGKNILTILKERFKDYKIDFDSKKIITIDNISITIRDLFDECPKDKHIWLNQNPTKFKEVKFNRDFSILFARIDNNNIIAYDLKTGFVLNKWNNIGDNWLDYDITHYGGDRIAIKSNRLLTKIWNFVTQREEATFYGYNSNSLCFSSDGIYLLCGIKNGSEIARIWDISNQKYGSFMFDGSNNNINTKVHLTTPQPQRVICCSVNQEPLIFNSYNKKLLHKCECPVKFTEILDIQSDLRNNIFIIKGKDNEHKNMGIMYQISDGSLLQIFVNYAMLELAKTKDILIITKCDNINNGKLCSIEYKNKEEQIFHDFEIQTNKCELMDDMQTAIIQYGDKYSKEFNLINIRNGNFIGKINFTNNLGRNTETYITSDEEKNELLFRYFELLSPEETMSYLKKCVYVVEGEDSK